MSKTVSEFFAELATRTGVPPEHEGMKTLLGMTAIIPDDVADKLGNLMTEKEAQSNIRLKSHFTAQFADGLDNSLPDILAELGLDEATISEIKAEKSTGKRVSASLRKLAEAKDNLIKAKADKDPEAITKANEQVKAANDLVNKTKSEYEAKLAEKDAALTDYKKRNELDKILSRQQWSEQWPEDSRQDLFNIKLSKELQSLGAIMVLDGDKLALKQAADPLLDFHHLNKAFTPSDLVAKVMMENKFAQVAPKVTEPQLMTGFRNQQANPLGDGAKHSAPSAFKSGLNQSLADQGVQL